MIKWGILCNIKFLYRGISKDCGVEVVKEGVSVE